MFMKLIRSLLDMVGIRPTIQYYTRKVEYHFFLHGLRKKFSIAEQRISGSAAS